MTIRRGFIVGGFTVAVALGAGCSSSTRETLGATSATIATSASACFAKDTCACDQQAGECADEVSCPADATCATCQEEQDDLVLYGDPRDYATDAEKRVIDWKRGIANLDGTPVSNDAGAPPPDPMPAIGVAGPVFGADAGFVFTPMDYTTPVKNPSKPIPVADQPDWLKRLIAACGIGGKFPYCDRDHNKENPDWAAPRIPNATFNCADFTYVFNTCGMQREPNMKWFEVATNCKPQTGDGAKTRHALSLVCDGRTCYVIEPQAGSAAAVKCSFQRGQDEDPPKIPESCRDAACVGGKFAVSDPEVSGGAGGNNGYLCHAWYNGRTTTGAVNACRTKMAEIGIDPDTCKSTR